MTLVLSTTGKVDNNTGRIPPLAGLSRFDHQVWCLASIRVACGTSQALEQVFKPGAHRPSAGTRLVS